MILPFSTVVVWLKIRKNDINGFSANEFSEKYNIPANYISLIRNGKFEVPTGNGSSPISDKYFRLIAEAVGLQLGNQITWKFKETPQSIQILSALEDAKEFVVVWLKIRKNDI